MAQQNSTRRRGIGLYLFFFSPLLSLFIVFSNKTKLFKNSIYFHDSYKGILKSIWNTYLRFLSR